MATTEPSKKVLIDLKPDYSLLNQEFEGYKLSLENVPQYQHDFETGISVAEPTADQFSFQHVRLFTLHNHLVSDPWSPLDFYYFNEKGQLVQNTWDATARRFQSQKVWSESDVVNPNISARDPGDFNYSINFSCKDRVFILNGRQKGTLCIIDTGDREKVPAEWKRQIVVGSMPAGVLMSAVVSSEEGAAPSFHCLVQTVVEAAGVEELKVACKQPGQMFASILQWITIALPSSEPKEGDSAKYEVTSQRDICVHGPVDYATLDSTGSAVYVASQKKAFFAKDSTRPVTPLMDRVLRKKVRYMWEQNDEEVTLKFSVQCPLQQDEIQVEIEEEGMLSVTITPAEGKPHCVISGVTCKPLAKETACSVKDGRVEVNLKKTTPGEKWVDFIEGDKMGQRAPDPELVREAQETLQHLTSETDEVGEVVPGFNCAQLEECDAAPPDTARLVRLCTDTHAPTHRVQMSAHQFICATQLVPGTTPALVLRHDVDAVVWQPEKPEEKSWKFTHVGTFNAFGYVQASKEQKKFVVCPPDLSYAAICESTQHIYLYHQPSALGSELRNRTTGKKVSEVARQQVVRTPASAGIVMGAVAAHGVLVLLYKNSLHALPIY